MANSFFSLFKSAFAKNTLTLISGTLVAQAFSFISLIIFQRWFFTPEDFGVLSIFTSFSSIFIAASTLKYEYALVMAKNEQDALNLCAVSFASVIVISCLSLVVLLVFPSLVPNVSGHDLAFFSAAVVFAVLFGGPYEILNYWNNRSGTFSSVSTGRIIQNITTELSRFCLIPFHIGHKILIVGRVFGQLASVIFLGRRFYKNARSKRHLITVAAMRKVAIANRNFPLFTMPTIIISNFTTWLFVYLFYDFYGSSVMGMVSIAIQYIALPFGILSAAFSQVFFKKIADIYDKKVLLKLYRKFSLYFFLLGLIVTGIVFLIPHGLVTWLLGEKWEGITVFMRTAVIWQTIAFSASSLSFIYTRLMKQKLMTLYALLQLALVCSSLVIGNFYFKSPEPTFLLFVAFQSCYYIFTIVSADYLIKTSKIVH